MKMGEHGGGQMHKRTTPKVFGRAKELHRNMTPADPAKFVPTKIVGTKRGRCKTLGASTRAPDEIGIIKS